MFTVILLVALFAKNSGEVISIKTLSYESGEQCARDAEYLKSIDVPEGTEVYARCVIPGAIKS